MNTLETQTHAETMWDLQTQEPTSEMQEVDNIHSIIIDGLMAIKWQIQRTTGKANYSMDRFFEHNLDCLNALMYGRLSEEG